MRPLPEEWVAVPTAVGGGADGLRLCLHLPAQ
jgi:hypothetical protein